MVKPPRTMQPEGVDLKKAGRAAGRAFQEDSFRNYMARKIDLQRKQFGVLVPPPPPPPPPAATVAATKTREATVSFAPDVPEQNLSTTTRKKRKRSDMAGILHRLKKRHGAAHRICTKEEAAAAARMPSHSINETEENSSDNQKPSPNESSPSCHAKKSAAEEAKPTALLPQTQATRRKNARLDLFFSGVVAIINGYTHPDSESLQRMLQQHGGDVERYETTRVTHVLAEHLSAAKAKIYARQKKPIPVVHPSWIVDCVNKQSLLPHAPYLIPEVRDLQQQPSVAPFFQKTQSKDRETPMLKNCKIKHEQAFKSSVEQRIDTTSVVPLDAMPCKASLVNPYASARPSNRKPQSVGENEEQETAPTSSQQPLVNPTATAAVDIVSSPTNLRGRTDGKYINGRIRTVGTDPNFLETFFAESRLSFIGSFRQRACGNSSIVSTNVRPGKRPPERYVLHVDMDSFFAAVVLRNYPEYKDKPVAICHMGKSSTDGGDTVGKQSTSECATINYEARKFGLRKGMFLGRARELCPSLIVLPYDFKGYEEVSEQVSEICLKYAEQHFGVVEAVSCDESYMEIFVDNEETVRLVAQDIRKEIFESTKCTATVGVARNKLLAKLATDRVKPNNFFVAAGHVELMRALQLRDLHGIGYRSEPKLAERGFVSVQDVWNRGGPAERELQAILGKQLGTKIYNFCHGKDDRPVQAADRKTIGAECNYGVRFDGPYGVDCLIEGLCKEVQKRMLHIGVTGTKVTLKVKQRKEGAKAPPKFLGHGSCHNLSKSLDLSSPSHDWEPMARLCKIMFDEMKVPIDDVRGMGVIVSKLRVDGVGASGGIKDFFQTKCSGTGKAHGQEESPRDRIASAKKEDVNGTSSIQETDQSAIENSLAHEHSDEEDDVSCVELMNLSQSSASSVGMEVSSRKSRRSLDSVFDDECGKGADAVFPTDLPTGSSERQNTGTYAVTNKVDSRAVDGHVEEPYGSIDDDFDIPALSQIDMSQVGALPLPMRQKIKQKLEEYRIIAEADQTAPSRVIEPPPQPLYRQTDVKRMMRLAAVKAGQAKSANTANISLTQLDRLPVEVQLQLANDDNLSLGKHSPHKSSRTKRFRNTSTTGSNFSSIGAKESCTAGYDHEDDNDLEETAAPCGDDADFFRENIFPLSKFLDENSVEDESLDLLRSFIETFMAEYSWYHVVLLLRSIRRRVDAWSAPRTFLPLFNEVNNRFRKETGEDLCLLQMF